MTSVPWVASYAKRTWADFPRWLLPISILAATALQTDPQALQTFGSFLLLWVIPRLIIFPRWTAMEYLFGLLSSIGHPWRWPTAMLCWVFTGFPLVFGLPFIWLSATADSLGQVLAGRGLEADIDHVVVDILIGTGAALCAAVAALLRACIHVSAKSRQGPRPAGDWSLALAHLERQQFVAKEAGWILVTVFIAVTAITLHANWPVETLAGVIVPLAVWHARLDWAEFHHTAGWVRQPPPLPSVQQGPGCLGIAIGFTFLVGALDITLLFVGLAFSRPEVWAKPEGLAYFLPLAVAAASIWRRLFG